MPPSSADAGRAASAGLRPQSKTRCVSSAGAQSSSKSRAPRWNIPPAVLLKLEDIFHAHNFPSLDARAELSAELAVKPRQIQVWFQNRRQRERNQQRQVLSNSDDISAALLGFCSGDEEDDGLL
ncbi:Homeodomain-like protein [Pavlovales sp. CCMP2436]|nr:Homeodomain-like protein [Pavlovales sp. CCMP2436]